MIQLPGGEKVVVTEADLFDYPGMDLTAGAEPNSLKGLFPVYPKQVELNRDRNERVVERENYIAKTRGTAASSPGACSSMADRDADLLEHRHRLSPRVRDDDEGHELDQAGQGGLGLVELPQRSTACRSSRA